MPSLNLAIARLVHTGTDNYAIWVVNAPYPSGYVLRDCLWPQELNQAWLEWQQMFAGHSRLDISPKNKSKTATPLPLNSLSPAGGKKTSYSSRLMQYMGVRLWRWVFEGEILGSLERSRGIAMGQHTRLRFRLEIREPDLIALPWEIMQRQPGQPAMSLSQHLLFSRTTSQVEPLSSSRTDAALNILLVLGEDESLQLEAEAAILQATLSGSNQLGSNAGYAPCMVKTLVKPTPQQLISELETKAYNVFFYAGHGLPGPDGGFLFLLDDMTLNGMELAQALTRSNVKLAVFNACWGAQPFSDKNRAIAYSSLAEVLIRQGVPAVLGMRDEITDEESHSFIQSFALALRTRKPIDEAVAEGRKRLLTIYHFNQPAWTLPVLYLHPHFDGELLKSFEEGATEIPTTFIPGSANVSLRSLQAGGRSYLLKPGVTRIGRTKENDIVIREPSVSKRHAEILRRNNLNGDIQIQTYYLQDFSTYGTTWVLRSGGWEQIYRREVPLESGMHLKFGSTKSQTWEFRIES
jgi:hypothetical protein